MDDKEIVQGLVIFAAGILVGGVSAFYFAKDKFKAEAEEEIKAMQLYYDGKISDLSKAKEVETYNDILTNQSYNVEKEEEMAGKEHPVEEKLAYEITPEEFDNPDNMHETTSCSFNPITGILVDDLTGEEVDISDVGKENLELFASRVDSDTMYIRNDSIGVDFEVIKVEEPQHYGSFEA